MLDESGSMTPQQRTIISGFNEQIQTMKHEEQDNSVQYLVSLVKFSSEPRAVFIDLPLAQVPELTIASYRPGGSTALYDAIGVTIGKAEPGEGNVLITIMTDGQENSSKEWNRNTIQTLIKLRQNENKWGFAYFGANVDAWAEANSMGIPNAVNFTNAKAGKAMVQFSMARRGYVGVVRTADYESLKNLTANIDEKELND